MSGAVTVRLPGAVFEFDHIQYKSGGMDATLSVWRESPDDPLKALDYDPNRVFKFHLGARSLSNVTNFRRELEKFHGNDMDWTRLLHDAIRKAEHEWQQTAQSVDPWARAEELGGDLIEEVFPMNRVSVVFGMGGDGKSLGVESALAAASQEGLWCGKVAGPLGNTLWLDYENEHEGDFGERREALAAGGVEFFPGSIRWMPGRGVPLVDLAERVGAEMVRWQCDRFVCDSVAFACGGKPETSEAATTFYAGLAQLPVSTKILIAHTDKAENDKYPFGSIFWHNGIHGMSWYVKGVVKDNQLTTAWYNRKHSSRPKPKDFATRFTFDGGAILLDEGNLRDVTQETGKGSAKDRIRMALNDGAKTPTDLAKALQLKVDVVYARLKDLRDAGTVTKLGDGTYGLSYQGASE